MLKIKKEIDENQYTMINVDYLKAMIAVIEIADEIINKKCYEMGDAHKYNLYRSVLND